LREMAKSQARTKVAVLRATIGISVKEFATMVGKSIHTINSLESGRLALSEQLAVEISKHTGVLLEWLFDESDSAPVDFIADELTREKFESHRASVAAGKAEWSYRWAPKAFSKDLKEILTKAEKRPNFDLVIYRVGKFLVELEREFLPDGERSFASDEFDFARKVQKPPKSSGSKKRRTNAAESPDERSRRS
jgi:DNA-binding XRE family transcriptional regulator